jgi:hypothetical protein
VQRRFWWIFVRGAEWAISIGAICGFWAGRGFTMWHCQNCGEQIDDEFDACWKCGTARDGTRAADFHAQPNDPVVPDLGPDRAPPPESEEERQLDRILHERLVEVCSAGNIVEADGLCELLEEAGIYARVVGEGPGVAAGGLALGEDVSPRIWVRESNVARAREVIDQWRSRQTNEPVELPESETPSEGETPVEAEYAALPSDVRLRFLSQGFFVLALISIALGAVWAWGNWRVLSTYSVADGRPIATWRSCRNVPVRGGPDQPLGKQTVRDVSIRVQYAYGVDGKLYDAQVNDAEGVLDHVPIYYNPHQPAEHIVGPIAPPWMILLFAPLVGAFFCFVGYQFR